MLSRLIAILVVAAACAPRSETPVTLDPANFNLVDLTHSYNAQTIYWPTSTKTFEHPQQAYGKTPGGWFYSSYELSTPEHGGTHLDAPIHFGEGKQTSDQIPLTRLVARAVVIDVSAKADSNRDYLLTVADVEAFEREHGQIAEGTIVLLRTGYSLKWPDKLAYLGDNTPGDASKLHFPSFGPDAARLLVEQRRVAALGADVASTDAGNSTDFQVHQIAASANVPGFENLTNLEQLPVTGAIVVALPMKIEGGSGGPLRAIAMVPRQAGAGR
jgi:kynurenine formamidase